MGIRVAFHDDPAVVLRIAGEYLASQPVRHNLVLSLLNTRLAHREPGRYWIAEQNGKIAGVAFQSPLSIAAIVTPMQPELVAAMVDAIADAGVVLPGVSGEAATAASFAGHWTERTRAGAIPFEGMRLYELTELKPVAVVEGQLRQAVVGDRGAAIGFVRGYQNDVRENFYDPGRVVDRWLAEGRVWLWDNGQPVSMAIGREQVAGVIRIGGVYTPPEHRRRGYAAACVHGLSKWVQDRGCRGILYTDLGNPTSNAIYRRMGYEAVAEGLRYRFE